MIHGCMDAWRGMDAYHLDEHCALENETRRCIVREVHVRIALVGEGRRRRINIKSLHSPGYANLDRRATALPLS